MKSRTLLILVVLLVAAAIAVYALGPGRGVEPPADPEDVPIRGEPPEAPEAPVPDERQDEDTDIDDLGEPVDPPGDPLDDPPRGNGT